MQFDWPLFTESILSLASFDAELLTSATRGAFVVTNPSTAPASASASVYHSEFWLENFLANFPSFCTARGPYAM